jgi:hypothetical protein
VNGCRLLRNVLISSHWRFRYRSTTNTGVKMGAGEEIAILNAKVSLEGEALCQGDTSIVPPSSTANIEIEVHTF